MKVYVKKTEEVYALAYEGQEKKELSKVLAVDCNIVGNGWEEHKTIKIGKSSYKIDKGDYIVKQGESFIVMKKANFEELFEEKAEELNNNKKGAGQEDVAILDTIDKGLKEETLKLEDLSEDYKALYEVALPYKKKTVKELKEICKERKLEGYSKYRENELVVFLLNDDKKGE